MNHLDVISTWAKESSVQLLALPHANASLSAAVAGVRFIEQPEAMRHSLSSAIGVAAGGLMRAKPAVVLCAAGDLSSPDQGVIRAQFAEWPLVIIRLQDLMHEPEEEDENAYACDWDTTVAQSLGLPGVPLLVRATPFDGDLADEVANCCATAARHRTPICILTTRAAMLRARDGEPPAPLMDIQEQNAANASSESLKHNGSADISSMLRPLRLPTGETLEHELHRLIQKVAGIDDIDHAASDIDPDAETLVVTFGLAVPAVQEAVQIVRDAGGRVSLSILRTLWPIPEKTLKRALTPFVRRVLIVERNPGLYARILRAVLPAIQIESLCRFDGEAIEPSLIARRITDWPCG